MTAYYETEIILSGTPEEVLEMIKILNDYLILPNKHDAYFNDVKINGASLKIDEMSLDKVQSLLASGLEIKADGPYGKFWRIGEINVFRDMAIVAPNAHFTGSISGGDSYSESGLKCELSNGLLTIDEFHLDNEEQDDAWTDDFLNKLPFEEFIKLFRIEGDFDEDSYRDFINEFSCDITDETIEYDFETFTSTLEDCFDSTTTITESEYNELMNRLVTEKGIKSLHKFIEEDYNGGEDEHSVYDPVKKEYL